MIFNTNTAVVNSPRIGWSNLVTASTLSNATSGEVGFPSTNLLNGYTTDKWIPQSMPAVFELTFETARNVNMVCFAGHNFATQGVTVQIQQRITGVWTTIVSVVPTDDDPLIISFPGVSNTEFRARFSGSITFTLAVIFFGAGLTIPGVIVPPHTPLHRVSEIELIGGAESGTGEFLQADVMRTGGRANLTMSAQLPGFATGTNFEQFRNHFNRGRPFFIACFPTFDPQDVGYVWRNGESLVVSYSDPVYMAINMEVGVYVV